MTVRPAAGLFGNSHTPYEDLCDTGLGGTPSLTEMTETAIKMLSKNKKGFFLAVSFMRAMMYSSVLFARVFCAGRAGYRLPEAQGRTLERKAPHSVSLYWELGHSFDRMYYLTRPLPVQI